jgi:DNA modification methylase
MPSLTWANKAFTLPDPATLELDNILYPHGAGYPGEIPQNRLILGDNLAVMSSLLAEYEGGIDLIYADPPFFTNRHYPARIGRGEDSRRPWEWELAEGYPDAWSDIEAYLDMLYPRLVLMWRLLSPRGVLFLHLDWHANAYARVLLDEIFGDNRLLNEIVWLYHGPSPIRKAFNRKHDTILVYTKTNRYTFNVDAVRQPYDPNTIKTFRSSTKAGFGKVPDLARGKVPEDWWYFPVVARLHNQRTGYPTQKPEALLERMILACSNPDDLVADFFCGAGTTALVAARLGRRFLVNDNTRRAVHTTCTRLVELPSKPFAVYKTKDERRQMRHDFEGENMPVIKLHRTGSKSVLKIDPAACVDLDYWEADPDWDGHIFHSAGQSVRARKERAVKNELHLPAVSGVHQVCVRFVDARGKQKQVVLNV